jgi:NADH:ubiquinone oxidoreductase subunit 2 (subunit N)
VTSDGIPWPILLPVTGGAGVLAFRLAGASLLQIRVWVAVTFALSLAAFALLSEPVADVAWTRAILAIVCATGVASTLSCECTLQSPGGAGGEQECPPDPGNKQEAQISHSQTLGISESTARILALLLFSLAAFAVTCQSGNLASLLVAHAAFLIAISNAVRLESNRNTDRRFAPRDAYLLVLSVLLVASGVGFLIALGGSTELDSIQRTLRGSYQPFREELTVGTASILGTVSFVLILVGVAIPFGAFPFQFGQLKLFDEQPAWLASWVAIAGRAQAFVLLWRVAVTTMPGFGPQVQTPLLVLAAASAFVGACLACRSTSLRELAGNCWLVHGGLLLHCVATGAGQVSMVRDDPRWQLPPALETGVLIFACSSVALIVLLLVESSLALPDRRLEFDEDLAGLVRQRPSTGGALAAALAAFCAVPPLASFWGVLYLAAGSFVPQYEAADFDILVPNATVLIVAAILILSLLILASRIVRLFSLMMFDEPLRQHCPAGGVGLIVAGVLAASLLFGGLLPGSLLRAIHAAM